MRHKTAAVIGVRTMVLLAVLVLAVFGPVLGQRGFMVGRAADSAAQKTFLPMALRVGPVQAVPDASQCKLPEAANRGNIGLGFPRYADRLPSTGIVTAKVIFVDFPDAPAALTPQEVYAHVSPSTAQIFQSLSYGRFDFRLEPHFEWLQMSQASTNYSFTEFEPHRQYVQEAVSLADPQVDFSEVQTVIVIANPSAGALWFGPTFTGSPAWGGISADGITLYNGVTSGADLVLWNGRWLNHETGHSLGLIDLYAYIGDTHRFVGGFDIMGMISGLAPEMMAYLRWQLGWLDDDQIYCQQDGSATVTLAAIATQGGVKAVMVPTGPTSLVVVESRRALGLDADLAPSQTGALVYTVDSAIQTGAGAIQILPDVEDKYEAPLGVGEQLTVGGVTIEVLSATSTDDTVRVTVTK
jgi:M6 family metalloprotease-like protein